MRRVGATNVTCHHSWSCCDNHISLEGLVLILILTRTCNLKKTRSEQKHRGTSRKRGVRTCAGLAGGVTLLAGPG